MAIIHIPQAFVTTPIQLIALRAVSGVFMGGTMPTANALLARSTSRERSRHVFGLSTSIQAGGRSAAPLVGPAWRTCGACPQVFLVTAGIFAVVATLVGTLVHTPRPQAGLGPRPGGGAGARPNLSKAARRRTAYN
jgi:MFS family permease